MKLFVRIGVGSRLVRCAGTIASITLAAGVCRPVWGQANAGSHRLGVALTVDGGSLPSVSGGRCGEGGEPVVGGGLSFVYRPRRWLVTAVDTRASVRFIDFGCNVIVPAPREISPGVYEYSAYRQYPGGLPGAPLVRSAFHAGVEMPGGLLRAIMGGGMIWTRKHTPYASFTLGGGSTNRGIRFVWELESNTYRLPVREVNTRYRLDPGEVQVPLPARTTDFTSTFRWTTGRIGLEVPLR